MYYYVLEEYRVSNELLTEDIYVSHLPSQSNDHNSLILVNRICKLRYNELRVTCGYWKTRLKNHRKRNRCIWSVT